MKLVSLMAFVLLGCASAPQPASEKPVVKQGLHIKLTKVYVDDQDKALRFYTEVLGFQKKADVENGGFRWLTVGSATDVDGSELQLAPATDPAAKAYQQALKTQNEPALMLASDDVAADYQRIKGRGGSFLSEPTEVMPGVVIVIIDDGCGNLVQLSQVPKW